MRILFIRHGDPDYANDTLTEKGHREAALLAERAESLNMGECFVSPLGRARHTADYCLKKTGKDARETVSAQYELEYGTSSIELHKDAIRPGQKVVIIDDLIATGGTVKAIAGLVEQLGGQVVKICFVMELAGLKGRERLSGYDVESAIIYEGK